METEKPCGTTKRKANTGNKNAAHLPIFGVGPLYCVSIVLLTIVGIAFSAAGLLERGIITNPVLMAVFLVAGMLLFAGGFLLWKASVTGTSSIVGYIMRNELYTEGVYAIVRNPCYSGIMMMCTGAILMAHHVWLLLLPCFFWLEMTILMKYTEEQWLAELYGQDYLDYCKKVNRCIPWFPRK